MNWFQNFKLVLSIIKKIFFELEWYIRMNFFLNKKLFIGCNSFPYELLLLIQYKNFKSKLKICYKIKDRTNQYVRLRIRRLSRKWGRTWSSIRSARRRSKIFIYFRIDIIFNNKSNKNKSKIQKKEKIMEKMRKILKILWMKMKKNKKRENSNRMKNPKKIDS